MKKSKHFVSFFSVILLYPLQKASGENTVLFNWVKKSQALKKQSLFFKHQGSLVAGLFPSQ